MVGAEVGERVHYGDVVGIGQNRLILEVGCTVGMWESGERKEREGGGWLGKKKREREESASFIMRERK